MTPSPRTIQRALDVLTRLPIEAQADLAKRIIDRLDLVDGDCDREDDDHDACEVEDLMHRMFGRPDAIGDDTDAEQDE